MKGQAHRRDTINDRMRLLYMMLDTDVSLEKLIKMYHFPYTRFS
jgi:hypothetical protein